MLRRAATILVSLVIILVSIGGIVPDRAAAQDGDNQQLPPIEIPKKGNPKLDSALNQLVSLSDSQKQANFALEQSIQTGSGVRVIVECDESQADSVAEALPGLGIVEARYDNLIQLVVPAWLLPVVAGVAGVDFVRTPFRYVPEVVSQGVALIDADDWQNGGCTGTGVKIAVLDPGFAGYATRVSEDELPASVVTHWADSIGGEGTSVHGTACAEIVYDVAPGAQLYLVNFSTEVEMGDAVDWLIGEGVDIISHSVGWPVSGPGDGTGPIDEIVDGARAAGILWVNAAGNDAQRHWRGNWADSNGNAFLNFTSSDETNTITVTNGYPIVVLLKWNDPWGASANDYDLYLLNSSLQFVDGSENEQNGNDDPVEGLRYTATYSGSYHIAIHKYGSPAAVNFHLYSFYQDLQYKTAAGSLSVPADSPNALAVGAVAWNSPATLESFSSRGPTKDGRTKPDLVGPDGVGTRSYSPDPFYGTSAATPHVAGAAALVKCRYSSYTPADMQSFLESAAVDLGTAGKDNLYGSGRLRLGAYPLVINAPSDLSATVASSSQIDLTWQDNSDNEAGFKIERKTGSGGTYAQIGTVGAGVTSYSNISLAPSTTYYYRVRAYNGTSNSDYCDEASATTLPAPPAAPALASPANGATVPTLTPRLQWNVVAGASDYGIQVATASTFASPVINETGITDLYCDILPSVLNWSTTYYWRVNAHNSAGTSAWSTYRSFKTGIGPPPDPPSDLVSTPVSSTRIDLTWQDNSINESSFKIERKTGVGGTYALVGTVGAGVTSYSNTALTASTTYYYRVRARNPTGYSAYCAEASATTLLPPPPKPILSLPANGATVTDLTPRLQWTPSTGASDYGLQVSTTSTFAVLLVNETGITDLYYDIPPGTINLNARYYWRVNARNASASTSLWSSSRYFKTPVGPAPDAPSDLLATAASSKQVDLTWQDNSINESLFKIERKTGAGGTYALVGTVGAGVTSYSNTALTASTTYYYRVRAWNPTGYSDYCAEASATTLPPPPPKPTLASPDGGALVSTLTPRLQWIASSGASDYGIQVSTTSTFAVLLVDETDITDLFFDVPPGTLSASTRYYWRVNASGASGSTSLWSSYRYFRTPAGP